VPILFAVCLSLASAQCPNFFTKINNLLTSILNNKSLDNMANTLVTYAKQDLSLQQAFDKEYNCFIVEKRTDCLPYKLAAGVPVTQYLSLMATATGALNCVLDTGYTYEQAIKDLKTPMFNIWTPVYQTLRTKAVTMMKNKKTDAEIKNQCCTLANSAITKALLQKTITTAKNKITVKKVWDCAAKYLPQVANPQYKLYTW
ncbi:hypothetical protein PMAYCL1PPCAC_32299, partial [Pristionchus mayeri]